MIKSMPLSVVISLVLSVALIASACGCSSSGWTNIGGRTFRTKPVEIGGLACNSSGETLFVGHGSSVWRCAKPGSSPSWTNSPIESNRGLVVCIAYDPARDVLFAAKRVETKGGGVWRCSSANTAPSWSAMGLGTEIVSCLTYDPVHDVLFAGVDGTGVWHCARPESSSSWTNTGGDFNGTSVESVAYDASRDIAYAGTSGTGVRRCIGTLTSPSWSDISGALIGKGSNGIRALVYDFKRNVLYAGTYEAGGFGSGNRGGVWRCSSPENSPSWTDTGTLSSYFIDCLAFDNSHNVLFAGTDQKGVWRCSKPDISPTWTSTGGQLNSFAIGNLAFDSAQGFLYASGYGSEPPNILGQSIWRYKP